ncbi:MAG: response regulator [Sphingorhabdus sp.]
MSLDNIVGKRIFIVEDDFMIAALLREMIESNGAHVVDTARTLGDALSKCNDVMVDAAILDINLKGEMSYPVAECLALRGVPVVFVTGYAQLDIPPILSNAVVLNKPYVADEIVNAVSRVCDINLAA